MGARTHKHVLPPTIRKDDRHRHRGAEGSHRKQPASHQEGDRCCIPCTFPCFRQQGHNRFTEEDGCCRHCQPDKGLLQAVRQDQGRCKEASHQEEASSKEDRRQEDRCQEEASSKEDRRQEDRRQEEASSKEEHRQEASSKEEHRQEDRCQEEVSSKEEHRQEDRKEASSKEERQGQEDTSQE